VVTALLVAGSTLTFWIPQFVSTSSYSSVVQALGCLHNCRRLTHDSFQLMQSSQIIYLRSIVIFQNIHVMKCSEHHPVTHWWLSSKVSFPRHCCSNLYSINNHI